MKRLRIVCGISAAFCLFAASAVRADMITYTLDNANSAVNPPYSPPYGSVLVDLTSSTTATITFTSDVVSNNIYLFGATSAVDVNVNAASWTLGPITGTNSGTGFSTPTLTSGGSGNVDGRGFFNQTIDAGNAFPTASDTVTFTLTDTSGSWANASSVLTTNNDGNYAAAHVIVTSDPAYATNSAFVTGYAGADTGVPDTSVPDGGSTVILLGSAMASLGSLRIFLRRK